MSCSIHVHSFIRSSTQPYGSLHWAIHVDLKINKIYVCQGERRESSEVKVEERIWYIHTLGPSVKLETKGKHSECNPVKGRSGLETETTIWYFSETLLSCIILLNSWRHALKPWVLQFFLSGLHLLTDIYTYFVTGCLFKKKKKKFPIVHFTTGNVEVRCSVDHSDIYGSRCTFKCKLIFTVGDMRHNDTYWQNP